MSRSKLLGAAIALPLMFAGATSAQANIIGLTIDGSGSISAADFTLQKNGYISALTALLNTDGSNTIGVWQFSSGVSPVFALTTIDSAAKKTALLTAIGAMVQLGNQTAIGASVATATAAISGFAGSNCVANPGRCLIDVSTDGVNNTGVDPTVATTAANAAGVKVNCLSVGGASGCGWNLAGLDFTATSFAQFTAAITAKLSVELTPTPEPITMSLFGAGLLGAAALRRRKNKTA
jgi:hypothetical protein